jgi:hypothetical protein
MNREAELRRPSRVACSVLLGRKFVKLIEVFFQKVSWVFGIWNFIAAQCFNKPFVPTRAMLILSVCAQIFIWNLVIFLPQSVEAVSLIARQEVQHPTNSFFDVGFGSVIKLPDSGIRQSRNLVAYENAKTVFASLNSSNASIVNQKSTSENSGNDWQIWNYVYQAVLLFFVIVFAGMWQDAEYRATFRPNAPHELPARTTKDHE